MLSCPQYTDFTNDSPQNSSIILALKPICFLLTRNPPPSHLWPLIQRNWTDTANNWAIQKNQQYSHRHCKHLCKMYLLFRNQNTNQPYVHSHYFCMVSIPDSPLWLWPPVISTFTSMVAQLLHWHNMLRLPSSSIFTAVAMVPAISIGNYIYIC